MIKLGITTLLAGVSFVMTHAADAPPQSPYTISKETPVASMWKRQSSKQKTDQQHSLPSVKEGVDNSSDENPIECTQKYTPSAGARMLFDQFLGKVIIPVEQKRKLATIFQAKPIKLDKRQRESSPKDYYDALETCREQNFMYTFLEFAHQKSEADFKDNFSTFEKEKLEQQQRFQTKYHDLERRAAVQDQTNSALREQLAQQQKQQQELQRNHDAHIATTEKRMQATHKINLALIGLTGASIAALAFVATHAMPASKMTSSPAATTAS